MMDGAWGAVSSRTLVVGAGFLGTAVAEASLAAGQSVTVLSRQPLDERAAARLSGAHVVLGDATDALLVEDALADVDNVVFCAGVAVPTIAAHDLRKAVAESLPPLLSVVDALTRRRPHARLLYLSSGGTVYGEPSIDPVPEEHPLQPTTAYGSINAEAERRLATHRSRHGVRTTSLRCANPYGPGQRAGRGQGLVGTLLWSDDEVPFYGDGSTVRDYIYVRDFASAVVSLCNLPTDLPPAINIGTGVGTSLSEVVALVEKVTERTALLRYEPARATDLRRVVLQTSLLESLIPFDPMPLDQGIAATYAEGLASGMPATAQRLTY
jgi:UDP-glucose 4-epimerase